MESAAPSGLVGGRYRVIRLIGRGGMGKVYEVEHVHTGDRLALKVLLSERILRGDAVERFKREARAATRIKSDHVVRVTDADTAPELGGSAYLVMELLEGKDLEHATRNGRQRPADVALWLGQVAHALDKAHALGIVHRDMKPENLFLSARDDGTPHVKVLDFGIAKMIAEQETKSSGQMIGTPAYMAPEQAVGASVTAATDRFAMGLIAFRFLVGESYWRGETVTKVMHELLYEPMPPPSARGSTFGPAFDAWFATACHRDPTKRFESSRAQTDALSVALGVAPAPAVSVRDLGGASDTPGSGAFDAGGAATSIARGARSGRRGLAYGATTLVAALALFAWVRSTRDLRPPHVDDARASVAAPGAKLSEVDGTSATPLSAPARDPDRRALEAEREARPAAAAAPPSRRPPVRSSARVGVAPAIASPPPRVGVSTDPLAEQK